jgi:hypothetical protein
MKKKIALIILCCAGVSFAVPTFQAYIDGATADSIGPDEDTWFSSGSGSFDLILVGAFGPNTQSLTNGTLVASVPQGETGTISVSGATLLTTQAAVANNGFNPAANADKDILTDIAGNDGYDTKNFAPDAFNNHYPFQDDVSDFVLFDVGSFSNAGPIHDYNADTGIISTSGVGQEKTFAVEVTGFSSVHFDLYGFVTTQTGPNSSYVWEINPGSHDSTFEHSNNVVIPAPGSMLLAIMGSGVLGFVRRFGK